MSTDRMKVKLKTQNHLQNKIHKKYTINRKHRASNTHKLIHR